MKYIRGRENCVKYICACCNKLKDTSPRRYEHEPTIKWYTCDDCKDKSKELRIDDSEFL